MEKNKSVGFRSFVFLTALAACGVLPASLLGYLGGATHDAANPALLAEFFSHFRLQYFALGLIATAVLLFVGFRHGTGTGTGMGRFGQVGLLAALATVAVNLAEIAPYYFSSPISDARASTRESSSLRILHANLLRGNTKYERVLKLIAERRPDLIFLQELDRPWFRAVASRLHEYPHRLYYLEPYFGIGVFSRRKPESMRIIRAGRRRLASLHVRMRGGGGIYHLISSHPPPPIGLGNTRDRNEQLAALARVIRSLNEPVVLVGDLNVGIWSPAFRRLLRDSGLRDTLGLGIRPTWPTNIPFMMIPIDHCLIKGALRIKSLNAPPSTGSDHRPLLCTIEQ